METCILHVQDIGALEAGRERLTLLGRHLAALPLPPRVGKLLLYGVLFRCLDPVLTIACAMAFRCARVDPSSVEVVALLPKHGAGTTGCKLGTDGTRHVAARLVHDPGVPVHAHAVS